MGWAEASKKQASKMGGGDYVKLKDGEHAYIVFIGEPICFYKKFGERPEYPDWADGRAFRFKTNVAVVNDNGEFEVVLLEQGSRLRKKIETYLEEYSENSVFKLVRVGSGKSQTSYELFHHRKLSEAEIAIIKKLPRIDLKIRTEADIAEYEKKKAERESMGGVATFAAEIGKPKNKKDDEDVPF